MTWMVWFPPISNAMSRPLSPAHKGPATQISSQFLDMPHSSPHQGLCPSCPLGLEPNLHTASSYSPFGSQLEYPLLWEAVSNHPPKGGPCHVVFCPSPLSTPFTTSITTQMHVLYFLFTFVCLLVLASVSSDRMWVLWGQGPHLCCSQLNLRAQHSAWHIAGAIF